MLMHDRKGRKILRADWTRPNCACAWCAPVTAHSISTLAQDEPFARELPVERLHAFLTKRALDLLPPAFGAEERDAAAAARPADFGRLGPVPQSFLDEHLHLRRGDAWRQPLAPRISLAHDPGDGLPVVRQQGLSHSPRRIADAVKEREEFRVAVDVPFRDLPVVRPRETRL